MVKKTLKRMTKNQAIMLGYKIVPTELVYVPESRGNSTLYLPRHLPRELTLAEKLKVARKMVWATRLYQNLKKTLASAVLRFVLDPEAQAPAPVPNPQ